MEKIAVFWHDEQHNIVRQHFQSGFTLAESRVAILRARALIDSVSHKVCLLTEIGQPLILPKGYLNELRHTAPGIRDNELIHVIVGAGIMVRSIMNLATRMNIPNVKYIRLADSIEHGLTLCNNAHATYQSVENPVISRVKF
jgi:hypothetical protein